MRVTAATVALLVAVEAAVDIDLSHENVSKLSRRHLLHQKHRLFRTKLRLKNEERYASDESDETNKHEKKSKLGNDWYELNSVQSLADVNGDEKEAKEIVTVEDSTTDEIVVTYNTEEDCIEEVRRRLAKSDKAGKDSKVKTTTATWVASKGNQPGSKSGKSSKAKTGKRGKSSAIKCQPVPPKPSGKPTMEPSQELPSVTSPPTTTQTLKPTEAAATPEPTIPVEVTDPPVDSAKTEAPTTSPSASATEPPITTSPTGSPLSLITESPTGSPSTSAVVTESPTMPKTTESPSDSPSVSADTTESPTVIVDAPTATESPSTNSSLTEAPVASIVTESPSTEPSSGDTVVTEAPVASIVTESPSTEPSSGDTVVTEAPVTSGPTTAPVASSGTCTFCEGGIPDPEQVVADTGGQTCAEVKASADEEAGDSVLCPVIQEKESFCCPEPSDVCTFCAQGITNPDALPPAAGGQTCSQVGELAAGETEGSVTCTTIQTEESTCCPEESSDVCTFCAQGITNPDALPPAAGGQTCSQVGELAAGETEGSDACTTIQSEESTCCPEESSAVCTFCVQGITNPDAVPPAAGGQTCSQVGELAAGETEGSDACTTIQSEESTCCPQTQSCTPLDPNPYTLEPPNNVFPKEPWTTGGDGAWAIDETNAQEGTYAIKSPDLEGSIGRAVSNATLAICDDFSGGVLTVNVLAPVVPPYDVFVYYVDGVEINRLAGQPEYTVISINLPPGAHSVDFQYQYNPFELSELPGDPPPIRQGAVWIDTVELTSM